MLVDPDQDRNGVFKTAQMCERTGVDVMLVGGSLVTAGSLSETISIIRNHYNGPVYLFPGNEFMVDNAADGILFLSLLSGRNPEYLIGKHVVAAPVLAKSRLDIVPTAYLLIDGGRETSVSYISNTRPIPADKPEIAAATALAGKMMGMRCIYMDAGSGALNPIPSNLISEVKRCTGLPLIAGGGVRNPAEAEMLYNSGVDLLVVGNGAEKNADLIRSVTHVRDGFTPAVTV